MKQIWKYTLAALAVGLLASSGDIVRAQIQYKSGQNILPIYEGWYKNPDGSIDMMFGYLNRNWEQDLQVPVGADNSFSGLPGGADQGQPTIFFHRYEGARGGREQFVFKVRLPRDFSPNQQVVWTLTANGRTDKAVATLLPVQEIDDIVIAENRGGGIIQGNKTPTVTLSASSQTASVSGSVKLTAVYKDDGLPKPRPPRQGPAVTALGTAARPPLVPGVKWIYHRGPSVNGVRFDPPASRTGLATDATLETTATFSEPGTYVLRAYAEDPPLFDYADVTITVSGARTTQGQQ